MNRLRHLFQIIFNVESYTSLLDRDRARTIYGIGALMSAGVGVLLVITLSSPNSGQLLGVVGTPQVLLPGLVMFGGMLAAAYFFTRRGRLFISGALVMLLWTSSVGLTSALNGLYNPLGGQIIIITVMLAALLLGRAGLLLGVAQAVLLIVLGIVARAAIPAPPPSPPLTSLLSILSGLFIASSVAYGLLRATFLGREEGLNQALAERLQLAELTAEITQRISGRSALDEVLAEAVEGIIASYPDIYHAQIFLVESAGLRARLAASTGDAGRLLLARGHSLEVGSRSVIGAVTGEGRVVVARAAGADSATVHRRNEYLPETRVEAAFPLRSGDHVIGALDLQSKRPAAFPERDLPVFQTLADQLAIAIDNARLFEETQRRLAENRSLLEQNEHALREVERYAARLTGQVWTQFLAAQPASAGLSLNLEQGTAETEAQADWLPALDEAAAAGTLVQQRANGHLHVAVPLRVRGMTLGAMAFQVPGLDALRAEDIALAQAVGDRLGIALENARLVDESQRAARRQALINQISGQLQASASVETTLHAAAHSLQTTLGAGRVAIRLGQPPAADSKKDGSA